MKYVRSGLTPNHENNIYANPYNTQKSVNRSTVVQVKVNDSKGIINNKISVPGKKQKMMLNVACIKAGVSPRLIK